MLGERLEGLGVVRRGRARPWRDRALAQGRVLVGDDQLGVDLLLDPEPAAGRTGAERIVEREQPRLDLGDREAGHRAGELLREKQAAVAVVLGLVGLGAAHRHGTVGGLGNRQAVGELERGLEALRQPLRDVGAYHDAVDHHVDVVLEFLVERRRFRDLVELAVDLDALEAALHPVGDLLAVFAFTAADHGRQDVEPGPFRQRQHPVDHLGDGLALDRQAGGGRIRDADAGPQQSRIVVDLGDGADRRARIPRGRLLLDRDRGRQAVDLVDVRLLHHLEELARIGRQALDVAALPFRIDGVEGERGFARSRQAGEHHQTVTRNLDVDILEIVRKGNAVTCRYTG